MSFHNQTNAGRVQKIVDTLALLQKSGASNNIDREDMWTMLEPAINLIGEMLGEEPQKPEPEEITQAAQQVAESTKSPEWARLREMLQKAPLKDLSVAMAVIMSRFDDELVSK